MIPRERLARYFEAHTRRFLGDGPPEMVALEVVEPEWGTSWPPRATRLLGITFDVHTDAIEFMLGSGERRVYATREVWTLEDPDGCIAAIQILCPDGSRHVVCLRRVGLHHHESEPLPVA
jgi:hypothetical protein